jgi:hypothetical protein
MPNDINAIKTRFTRYASDKKITSAETDALIKLCKDGGGVTNSEKRQIRELFIANGDKFEPAAREKMNTFIEVEIPKILIDENVVSNGTGTKKDLADPTVLKEDVSNLKYSWVNGQLFVGGVSKDDVVQGQVGNCYMMAGFAAVAAQSPDVIQKAIKDNKDGTFTVRFYQTSFGGPAKPVDVTIDGQLPTQWGGLRYSKGKDRNELWVPLLEKAFAQWKGGYDAIGHGGSAGNVITALTGRPNSYDYLSPSSNGDAIFTKIKTALASGKAAAAGTHGDEDKALYTGTGIYADHAYTITGVSESGGQKFVHLRNPWGEVEPSGDGVDDGNFKIPMSQFLKLYQGLMIA